MRPWAALLTLLVGAGALASEPSLELTPCRLAHPQGLGSVEARCGTLEVAENPSQPEERRIGLSIAVLPAISARGKADPLFLLAGGPGQGAGEAFVPILGALGGVRRDRDLVLVDQRGTGDSNRLDCDLPLETLEFDASREQIERLSRECLQALPGDPRFYTTSVAVTDLEAARVALGYPRINLYGASYGTRVAQHYARRYPQYTRSLVLDGVVPPGLVLGPAIAIDADRALRALFERCRGEPACHERYPSLAADFAALQQRLARQPAEVSLPDPLTGEVASFKLGEGHLLMVARMSVYSDLAAAVFPLLIDQAAHHGNLIPLAARARLIEAEMSGAMAMGMHNAVACSEDAPFMDTSEDALKALDDTFLGRQMVQGLQALCADWPRGLVDEDLKQPLQSPVPALLWSGEFDPVTPPAYGAAAAAGFTDAMHLSFRGQGHIQLVQRCAQSLLQRFLDAGSAQGLDVRCVDDSQPAPFMVNFNGVVP
ncbi:MAG: alpha/beta hydrolase [Steroidobacteraceae bacterium]